MLKLILSKIIQNQNLTQKEAYDFMNGIMKGEATPCSNRRIPCWLKNER